VSQNSIKVGRSNTRLKRVRVLPHKTDLTMDFELGLNGLSVKRVLRTFVTPELGYTFKQIHQIINCCSIRLIKHIVNHEKMKKGRPQLKPVRAK
jgi:hypothetical protein